MNLKKICFSFLCLASLHGQSHAFELRDMVTHFTWESGAVMAVPVAISTLFWYTRDRLKRVEAKVDKLQVTCDTIALDQKKMAAVVNDIDIKVTRIDVRVGHVQKTSEQLLDLHQQLHAKTDHLQNTVNDQGLRMNDLHQTVEARLSVMTQDMQANHAQEMAHLDSIKKNMVEKQQAELFMKSTEQALNNLSQKNDTLMAQSQKNNQEISNLNGLIATVQSASRVASQSDRMARRIKALYGLIKKGSPELAEISDSDDEKEPQAVAVSAHFSSSKQTLHGFYSKATAQLFAQEMPG